MTTYVALLRGINVSGQKLIPMAELKRAFEMMGFRQPRTYIQSGNVLFGAAEAEGSVRDRIERGLQETFGFPVPTIVRTVAEMERILADCPFDAANLAAEEERYLTLLAEAPTEDGIARLSAVRSDSDEFRVAGREVYLLVRHGYSNTKLTNSSIEKKLGIPATSRNWRTVTTLAQMGKAMAD